MQPSEKIDPTGVTAIWGGRRSGKTYFAQHKVMPQLRGRRIVVVDPQADGGESFITARDFLAALYDGERLLTLTTGNPDEVIPALYGAWAFSTKEDPTFAICDEAPEYLHRTTANLNRIMYQGRHRGFGMAILGQRVSAVAASIRSQAADTFFFRLNDHVDLATAQKVIGSDRAQKLQTFQPGQYIRHPDLPNADT